MTSNFKLPLIVAGATGDNGDKINGIFLFQGNRNDTPFYKNFITRSYCYISLLDSKWHISHQADFEANLANNNCESLQAGFGHPSCESRWLVPVSGKLEEQPAMKVATMVYPRRRDPFHLVFKVDGEV